MSFMLCFVLFALFLVFHIVIGVRRLNVQQDGFIQSTAFHHAYVISTAKIFPSACCSPIVSCHRQLILYPKFLHISHRENASFEVLSLHEAWSLDTSRDSGERERPGSARCVQSSSCWWIGTPASTQLQSLPCVRASTPTDQPHL